MEHSRINRGNSYMTERSSEDKMIQMLKHFARAYPDLSIKDVQDYYQEVFGVEADAICTASILREIHIEVRKKHRRQLRYTLDRIIGKSLSDIARPDIVKITENISYLLARKGMDDVIYGGNSKGPDGEISSVFFVMIVHEYNSGKDYTKLIFSKEDNKVCVFAEIIGNEDWDRIEDNTILSTAQISSMTKRVTTEVDISQEVGKALALDLKEEW